MTDLKRRRRILLVMTLAVMAVVGLFLCALVVPLVLVAVRTGSDYAGKPSPEAEAG